MNLDAYNKQFLKNSKFINYGCSFKNKLNLLKIIYSVFFTSYKSSNEGIYNELQGMHFPALFSVFYPRFRHQQQ